MEGKIHRRVFFFERKKYILSRYFSYTYMKFINKIFFCFDEYRRRLSQNSHIYFLYIYSKTRRFILLVLFSVGLHIDMKKDRKNYDGMGCGVSGLELVCSGGGGKSGTLAQMIGDLLDLAQLKVQYEVEHQEQYHSLEQLKETKGKLVEFLALKMKESVILAHFYIQFDRCDSNFSKLQKN